MNTSDAQALFESKAFRVWRENEEAKSRMDAAVVDRLNGVMRGMGILAKAIARTR